MLTSQNSTHRSVFFLSHYTLWIENSNTSEHICFWFIKLFGGSSVNLWENFEITLFENFLLFDINSTNIFFGHLFSIVSRRPTCAGKALFESAPCISLAAWNVSGLHVGCWCRPSTDWGERNVFLFLGGGVKIWGGWSPPSSCMSSDTSSTCSELKMKYINYFK